MVGQIDTVGEATVFVRCAEARLPNSDEMGLRLYEAQSQWVRYLGAVAMAGRYVMVIGDDGCAVLLM